MHNRVCVKISVVVVGVAHTYRPNRMETSVPYRNGWVNTVTGFSGAAMHKRARTEVSSLIQRSTIVPLMCNAMHLITAIHHHPGPTGYG